MRDVASLTFCLSFKIKGVGSGAVARSQSLVHKLLVMVAYSEGLVFLLKF